MARGEQRGRLTHRSRDGEVARSHDPDGALAGGCVDLAEVFGGEARASDDDADAGRDGGQHVFPYCRR
jgi:hypothetical protein